LHIAAFAIDAANPAGSGKAYSAGASTAVTAFAANSAISALCSGIEQAAHPA